MALSYRYYTFATSHSHPCRHMLCGFFAALSPLASPSFIVFSWWVPGPGPDAWTLGCLRSYQEPFYAEWPRFVCSCESTGDRCMTFHGSISMGTRALWGLKSTFMPELCLSIHPSFQSFFSKIIHSSNIFWLLTFSFVFHVHMITFTFLKLLYTKKDKDIPVNFLPKYLQTYLSVKVSWLHLLGGLCMFLLKQLIYF